LQEQYNFFKRINGKKIPLLKLYEEYLGEEINAKKITDADCPTGVSIYLSYVERFMLCVMRATKR
jgi:hypothetical protein